MWAKCSHTLLLWLNVIAGSSPGENILESRETDVSKFFSHLDVIPDVISVGPQEFRNVTYLTNIHANRGVQLQPLQANLIAGKDHYYTLIMTDPDVPDESVPSINDTAQKDWLKFPFEQVPKHSTVGRGRFSTRDFANKYDLAGNYFTSQWSKDVPLLHKVSFKAGEGNALL